MFYYKDIKINVLLLLFGIACLPVSVSAKLPEIVWQSWSENLFEKAQRENKFVILDLEAVWCHWCHVMEEVTYQNPNQATRLYPASYKRLEWWDRSERPMPNSDVQYPELENPAVFACSDNRCSLPVTEAKKLARVVSALNRN